MSILILLNGRIPNRGGGGGGECRGSLAGGETAMAFPLVESIVLVLLELLSRVDSFVTLQPAKLVCP